MFNKFIQRPVLSIVISLVIVFLGVLAMTSLPVTQFPSISPPKVNITAEYPGANGELMVKAVVIPLERAINGVPGMKYITSDAGNDGEASIQVIFNLGTDPNQAAINIQNRVASVINKLPPLVVREGLKITREEPNMLLYINLFSKDKNADQKFLYNYADINILSDLKRVNGVGFADILGNRDYAMRIWLKPDRMLAYKISAEEIMESLSNQSLEASPGKTGESSGKRSQAFEYVLKYKGRYTTKEGYENIVVRSNANGELLRLKDVANVEFGSSMYDIYSSIDGKPSAAITVKQSYGSNASQVIKDVKAKMEELKKQFPNGMDYEISYDVSKFLDASIEKVLHTLVEAFILVGLVVFIFLGDWRSTIIPAIAVPVSLIGTFAFMQLFGITINLITLFALVLAIGVVVDDAIVVIEAVHAKMEEEHLSARKATKKAMSEIGGAIIAITFLMAAVFIPVAFMSGPVGIFYRQFSITMATAIILSGIVALTLTPALCAIMLKNVHGKERPKNLINRFLDGFNAKFANLTKGYQKVLSIFLTRRTVSLGVLLAFCAGIFFINMNLPSGFIPTEDQGMFYAIIQTPPGSSLERTNEVAEKLQKMAEKIDGVQSVSALAGYEILTEGTGANTGTCLINLKSWEKRHHNVEEIIKELEEESIQNIPGATIEFFQPPAVPGYGAAGGFELRLLDKSGSGDYKKMETVSKEFVRELKKRPELTSVFTFYSASFPQYMLDIDNDLAQQKGVSIENAMSTLSTLVGSNYETNFIKYDRQYKVIVQASPEYRALPEDILKLYVKNNRDEMVPFSAFMKMHKVYGLSEITRHNMYNAAEISGAPAIGYSSGTAIEVVKQVAAKTLPRGFGIDWAGISADEVARGNEAIYIFLICLGFVYLVLAAQYESFILPFVVVLSLPAGIFGAFLCLQLFGLANNIYAQVAFVMLIGLLGKNAVLIVEFAAQKHSQGVSVIDAAMEGAAVRFRPILMTSFAFIAGLIPLAVASDPGKIGNRTLGSAAAGGMLVGTVCGVVIIPGLYYIFATISEKYKFSKHEDENPFTEYLNDNK